MRLLVRFRSWYGKIFGGGHDVCPRNRLSQLEAASETLSAFLRPRNRPRRWVSSWRILVFLDIQMPEMDGFRVIEEVGVEQMPVVIFVTAYDQYALQAFDAHALDYVLKPIDEPRFREALNRARDHLQRKEMGGLQQQVRALLDQIQASREGTEEKKYLERLVIKEAGRVFFLKAQEIDWLETAGNYVRLHVGQEVHLIRGSLNSMEAGLSPDSFLRIGRSQPVR